MKELSNTEAELKKSLAYIKKRVLQWKGKSHVNGICFMYHVKKMLAFLTYCLSVLQKFFSPTLGSDILATPPSLLMSAGTLSNAITAQAY